MGGSQLIEDIKNLNPAKQISDAADSATSAVKSAGSKVASWFSGSESTQPAQESYGATKAAQSQSAADELTVRNYLQAHPNDPLGITRQASEPYSPAKREQVEPGSGEGMGQTLADQVLTDTVQKKVTEVTGSPATAKAVKWGIMLAPLAWGFGKAALTDLGVVGGVGATAEGATGATEAASPILEAQGQPMKSVTPEVMEGPVGASAEAKDVTPAPETPPQPLTELTNFAQRRRDALQEATRGLEVNPETGFTTRRPRAADLAEAAANPLTEADVEAMQPGLRRLAPENVAIADFIHKEGADIQQGAIDALKSGDASDAESVVSKFLAMGLSHEPKLQAAMHEAGRGVGILNDPVSAKNAYIQQFTDLFNSIAEGKTDVTANDLLHSIASLQTPEQVARYSASLAANGGVGLTRNSLLNAWVNGLLSFNTVAKKAVSDAYHLTYQVGARSLAEAGGYVQRSLGAAPESAVSPGETMSMIRAAYRTFGDASRIAYSSFKDNVPWFNRVANLADSDIGFGEGRPVAPITSKGTRFEDTALGTGIDYLGHLIGLPSRGILGVDQFSKMMAYRMELAANAEHGAWTEAAAKGLTGKEFADYVANRADELAGLPSTGTQRAALTSTKFDTFTQKVGGPGMVGKFERALEAAQQTEVGTMIMPFYRTPMNIASSSLMESPLGMISAGYKNAIDSADARSAAIARGSVGLGTLIASAGMYLIHNENITGAAPQDKQLRDLWLRQHQEYAFEFNDPLTGKRQSFQYGQVEPVGTLLGTLADIANGESQMSQHDLSAYMGLASVVASQQLERQSFFKNFVSIVHLLDSAKRGVQGAAAEFGNLVGSIVPSNAANLAKGIDPSVHEVRGIGDAILSRTPGFSKTLPPDLNLFGEPILRQPGYLANQISVLKHMSLPPAGSDKVVDELLRLANPLPEVPWTIAGAAPDPLAPETARTGVPLTPEEHHRFQELVGDGMRARLEHLISSPNYAKHSDALKAEAIETEIRAKIETAREALIKENPSLMQRWLDRLQTKKDILKAPAAPMP